MSNRKRSRSRSPVFRSRSKSPGEWKRPERRGNGRPSRGDKLVRLYVSNLPYEVKWPELKDLFKDKVGNEVSYAQMYEDPDGRPSGAAVLEIKSREAAENAIQMLDRSEFRGRKIIVREEREKDRMRHTSSSRQEQGSRNDDLRNLISGNNGRGFTMDLMHQLGIEVNQITSQVFVANLDYKVTKEKLEEVFRVAGNVIEAEIKTDKEGKSRGMGIVRFEHPIEAVQAISLFTNQYLYDRQLFVRMDKWVDPIMQDIPSRLPNGLRGIGVGMGARGHPLLNIGEIANTIALGLLTGQLGGAQLGFQNNNLGLSGSSSSLNTNLSAANILSAVPGLLGSAGLSNIGTNALDGNHLLNQVNSGSGLAQTAQQAASVLLTSLGLNALAGLSNADLSSNIGNGLLSTGGNVGGGGVAEISQYSTPQGNAVNSSSSYNLTHSSFESRDQNTFDRNYDRGISNERADPRSVENSTVFVKNIPFNFSTQNMYEKFRDCGDIKYAEIKTDGSGRSRGYGLVQFYNSDSARRAISLMNGARIEGRPIEVRLDRLM